MSNTKPEPNEYLKKFIKKTLEEKKVKPSVCLLSYQI
jgi:hypothetical protein